MRRHVSATKCSEQTYARYSPSFSYLMRSIVWVFSSRATSAGRSRTCSNFPLSEATAFCTRTSASTASFVSRPRAMYGATYGVARALAGWRRLSSTRAYEGCRMLALTSLAPSTPPFLTSFAPSSTSSLVFISM